MKEIKIDRKALEAQSRLLAEMDIGTLSGDDQELIDDLNSTICAIADSTEDVVTLDMAQEPKPKNSVRFGVEISTWGYDDDGGVPGSSLTISTRGELTKSEAQGMAQRLAEHMQEFCTNSDH